MRNALPVLTVLLAIMAIWYAAVAPMNIRVALDQAQRGGAVLQPATALERQEVSVWSLMLRNPAQIKDA